MATPHLFPSQHATNLFALNQSNPYHPKRTPSPLVNAVQALEWRRLSSPAEIRFLWSDLSRRKAISFGLTIQRLGLTRQIHRSNLNIFSRLMLVRRLIVRSQWKFPRSGSRLQSSSVQVSPSDPILTSKSMIFSYLLCCSSSNPMLSSELSSGAYKIPTSLMNVRHTINLSSFSTLSNKNQFRATIFPKELRLPRESEFVDLEDEPQNSCYCCFFMILFSQSMEFPPRCKDPAVCWKEGTFQFIVRVMWLNLAGSNIAKTKKSLAASFSKPVDYPKPNRGRPPYGAAIKGSSTFTYCFSNFLSVFFNKSIYRIYSNLSSTLSCLMLMPPLSLVFISFLFHQRLSGGRMFFVDFDGELFSCCVSMFISYEPFWCCNTATLSVAEFFGLNWTVETSICLVTVQFKYLPVSSLMWIASAAAGG